MEIFNFDAYIVPLDEQGRREWISGFTGSNGDCIITKTKVSSKQNIDIFSVIRIIIIYTYYLLVIYLIFKSLIF